jgi:hypothetical protein
MALATRPYRNGEITSSRTWYVYPDSPDIDADSEDRRSGRISASTTTTTSRTWSVPMKKCIIATCFSTTISSPTGSGGLLADSPVPPIGQESATYDLRQGAARALLGQTLRDTLNSSTIAKLTAPVTDDRVFTRGIRVSLDNDTTRINTAWVSDKLMAGGQQVLETPRPLVFSSLTM